MKTDEAIERVKVICAPPGSVLVFVFNVENASHDAFQYVAERLKTELSDYRVICLTHLEDIRAIVPESPPPVVNNYNYNATPCSKCNQVPNGQTGEYPCPVCGVPTLHDTPDYTMEGQK